MIHGTHSIEHERRARNIRMRRFFCAFAYWVANGVMMALIAGWLFVFWMLATPGGNAWLGRVIWAHEMAERRRAKSEYWNAHPDEWQRERERRAAKRAAKKARKSANGTANPGPRAGGLEPARGSKSRRTARP